MAKLTNKEQCRITKDWSCEFPTLSIYKPLWLLRRVGPLLIGICLERSSTGDRYNPVYHYHNLLIPRENITLSLAQPLMNKNSKVPEQVVVSAHDDSYKDASRRLSMQHPLLTSQLVTTSSVFDEYIEYLTQRKDIAITRYPLGIYLDTFTLAKYFGFDDYANDLLDFICHEVAFWPKTEFSFNINEWKNRMVSLSNRESQDFIISKQLIEHKLISIINQTIKVGISPPRYWS